MVATLASALLAGACSRQSTEEELAPPEPLEELDASESPGVPGPDMVEDEMPPGDEPTRWAPIPLPVYQLGQLAPPPEWNRLGLYQHSITRSEFQRLLEDVYTAGEGWSSTIAIESDHAAIQRSTTGSGGDRFRLYFSSAPLPASSPAPPRYWRAAADLPPASDLERLPLEGVRIALDPGHIGGEWAKVEERWFKIGQGSPVMEGSLTLKVAELLAERLAELGATVMPVRTTEEPVTKLRIADLMDEARRELRAMGVDPDAADANPSPSLTVDWRAEKLFYRTAEIRARADLVNNAVFPDLTVCIHFNAEAWGNPGKPDLVARNHLHVLVNGCYSETEIRLDDQRYELLLRLLQRISETEIPLADAVAESMAEATGLPAYTYLGSNAKRVSANPYVWGRNLLANRTFHCPVVFLEPYVMNNQEVYERIQAGDYPGEKSVAGQDRRSIFREYADAVADGLAKYYREARHQ
ncbi:hypothetical protein BH23VER1_BH23VER1_02280 [soil metagenome]